MRKRKTAESFAEVSSTKALLIPKGPGEKLNDIPNVAFKLSKRKADECLHILHTILFGRKANVRYLKRNILQFSGFVWSHNEEKDMSKVNEKLNKCNKDRLLEFCDLLDIYTVKVSTKKEEILVKLLKFLESPHVTREMVLEKIKGKKRAIKGQVTEACMKNLGNKKGKDNDGYVGPSAEEIYAAFSNMYKEMDWDVVTVGEAVNQLGTHFKMDLTHQMTMIKRIIFEVIDNSESFDMKPRQKRKKEVIELCTKKKKITNVSKKKKCAHESCPRVIPKDIIFSQILPRLPFKILCKLKCISKEWCHIISYEPHFMLQQSCCISAVPASYICFDSKIKSLCILPTCGNPAGIPDPSLMAILRKIHVYRSGVLAIVASTNGLLCLMCGVKIEDVLIDIFPIVCNPATRECTLMPYDIKLSRNTIGHGFGLAFDPSAKPASYKLVQVLLMHSSSMSEKFGMIYVYSSDTGRWIKSKDYVSISSFEKVSKYFLYKKSVFVRGVIYWKLSHDMLYYDIENDAAGTISFPRQQNDGRIDFEEIGQCGGCATLTRITGTTLDLWMLLGYGHNPKWELMHRVSLKGILERFSRGRGYLQPLPCNNDEKLIYVYIRGPEGKNELVSYDIKGGKLASCGSFLVKKSPENYQNWIFSYNNSSVVLPRKKAQNCPSKSLCVIA